MRVSTIKVANSLDPDQGHCFVGQILVQTVCKDYKHTTLVEKLNQHKNYLFWDSTHPDQTPTRLYGILFCCLPFFQSHLFRKVRGTIKYIESRSAPTLLCAKAIFRRYLNSRRSLKVNLVYNNSLIGHRRTV